MFFGENLPWLNYLTQILDILVVTYVIYKAIMIIRGTRAVQLLKGITVILIVYAISIFFNLRTLGWIVNQAITYGLLAVIIIFQPELRRALEQLGRGRFFASRTANEEETMKKTIDAIVKASTYMGKRRIGALISMERETGMTDYVETGIPMNANLTSELLINTFIPNTPLHDGAVIINNDTILAAACYLPLSENPFISKELGTRHRAALGVSEVTDCLTIVVSEETGHISLTKNGELHRDLDEEQLRSLLEAELISEAKMVTTSRWQWGGKKNG
ncbi:diadenylate cyclase CdaA [Halalkalibacterium halodurans]|jgi:diadenylate cyclase|uniref:Diadenylate cyclase n=2 Tax=Halalkalibacterium halodurans TaxID=86665 RepID=Q9KG48_HALH5|nr:diadenylate cyclase CdaA [Halalkalibacterium halodurans]MDY7220778.1 diadenylate cyclase CdaA [Halalkalibacterium halodurans]MDY7240017.1 diadenylate cyclase CdaA [Halalkalibacterium halodurans]MED3647096.1 diadenylate cyclase CdaA [Halalkalibacterium halodurans]MED4082431.1 diadenylate cyclase CdaA [Halalkalibacterium halodurans]MED4084825.1 diadenylate cyclase CdaA [Halalkalibacterium halodurans]